VVDYEDKGVRAGCCIRVRSAAKFESGARRTVGAAAEASKTTKFPKKCKPGDGLYGGGPIFWKPHTDCFFGNSKRAHEPRPAHERLPRARGVYEGEEKKQKQKQTETPPEPPTSRPPAAAPLKAPALVLQPLHHPSVVQRPLAPVHPPPAHALLGGPSGSSGRSPRGWPHGRFRPKPYLNRALLRGPLNRLELPRANPPKGDTTRGKLAHGGFIAAPIRPPSRAIPSVGTPF
jgi:hypothetical protein